MRNIKDKPKIPSTAERKEKIEFAKMYEKRLAEIFKLLIAKKISPETAREEIKKLSQNR